MFGSFEAENGNGFGESADRADGLTTDDLYVGAYLDSDENNDNAYDISASYKIEGFTLGTLKTG